MVVLASAVPALAQQSERSSWGVAATIAPQWKIPTSLEPLALATFSEDDGTIAELGLKGSEFRIGIARGRALSGDWGVSFLRRSYDDADLSVIQGGGYQSSSSGGVTTVTATSNRTDLRRRDIELTGVEVHKFIPFGTIARRVQIGLNLGGGFGTAKGTIESESFETTTTCRIPGVLPFVENPCELPNATITGQSTVLTDSLVSGPERLFTLDKTPIGHVEVVGAVILSSQFKIRIGGGLNFPGTNNVTVTGVYFFSRN
jgi:hypothetical protein